MEKYPVPNKCRVTPGHEETTTTTTGTEVTQLRSRLRPPTVSSSTNFTGRPLSVQLSNSRPVGSNGGTDTNGNIPRPSSLPRLLKATEPNVAAKIESLLTGGKAGKPATSRPDLTRLMPVNTNRTIINPPPVKSSAASASNSPSPSGRSVASSIDSNRSASVADSGIATSSSRSPSTHSETVNNKNTTALPVANKFGFVAAGKKPSSTVERMNYANSTTGAPAKEPPTYLNKAKPPPLRIPSAPVKATSKMSHQPTATRSSTTFRHVASPQLAQIKSRAAQVLAGRRSVEPQQPARPSGPRLSVEAIVASLEQEMRQQLGPDPPPLAVPVKAEPDSPPPAAPEVPAVDVVARFLAEPANAAEITFIESESGGDEEDFIEDIELQLETPSTSCSHSQNNSP